MKVTEDERKAAIERCIALDGAGCYFCPLYGECYSESQEES